MKYLISVVLVCLSLASLSAQGTPSDPVPGTTDCTQLNRNFNLPSVSDSDHAEHVNGFHGVLMSQPRRQCSYTHGSSGQQYCITQCDLVNGGITDSSGGLFTGEIGQRNPSSGVHGVGVRFQNGQSTGGGNDVGDTVCAGRLAGGAARCNGNCDVEIDFALGQVFVFNAGNPSDPVVWNNHGIFVVGVCQSLPDPQNQVADGGSGPPNDPCNTDAGVGVVGLTDGSGPPPTDCLPSPILIDTEGEGFHLTSAGNGVTFDIRGDGHPIRIGWTAPGFHNAFLALDRNGNGAIDSGLELFGNFTQQPPSRHKNGFLALAEFDKLENGGNGDGLIDERDAVFSRLVLWIDENHDGISQPNELHKLSEFGIYSLTLSYFESRKQDEFGNQFRYRARINPDQKHRDSRDETKSGEPGRWAYDVFFTTK